MAEHERYVNLRAYQRMYGGSYATLKGACERGELKAITTPSGHFLIDTQPQGASVQPILDRLVELEAVTKALARHLGVRA